jgi:hypothetical protein
MSQTPRVPRIYVNLISYLKAMNLLNTEDSVYDLNPSKKHDANTLRTINVPDDIFNTKAYVAFLGHESGELNINEHYTTNVSVNANISTDLNSLNPQHEGFSIASFNGQSVTEHISYTENAIGSIVLGNYWEAPHAVDLALTLGYEQDGVKVQNMKGGGSISNATYLKPADWWSGGAWQLGNEPNIRSGRRTWSLSFSFLSEDDVFSKVAASTNLENATYNSDANPTNDSLYDSTDFFTQVWNRTLGNHLEFILQVDKDDFSPDGFAICRFDQNSLQLTQTSPFTYSTSVKIREVW